eukprot:2563621-Rhodomonas_salina.1
MRDQRANRRPSSVDRCAALHETPIRHQDAAPLDPPSLVRRAHAAVRLTGTPTRHVSSWCGAL